MDHFSLSLCYLFQCLSAPHEQHFDKQAGGGRAANLGIILIVALLFLFPVTLQMLLSLEAEQSSTRGYQASVSCQQNCEIQMLCLPCSRAAQTPHLVCSLQFLKALNFKDFRCRERLQAQKAAAWIEPGVGYCWQQG